MFEEFTIIIIMKTTTGLKVYIFSFYFSQKMTEIYLDM